MSLLVIKSDYVRTQLQQGFEILLENVTLPEGVLASDLSECLYNSFAKDIALENHWITNSTTAVYSLFEAITLENLPTILSFGKYGRINIDPENIINRSTTGEGHSMGEISPVDASADYKITTPNTKLNNESSTTENDTHSDFSNRLKIVNLSFESKYNLTKFFKGIYRPLIWEYNQMA